MASPSIFVIAAAHYHVPHRWAPTIAHERGFFAQEGLESYQVITTDHNEEKFYRALKAGEVHVGLDCKPRDVLRYAREMDLPLRFIAGWRNQSPFVFFVNPGVTSPSEMRGKRIGVRDFGGVDAVQARYWVAKAGLHPDKDVTWVRGSNFAHGLGAQALRNGEVDCIPVPDEQASEMEAQGLVPLVRLGRDAYPDGYPERGVVTTTEVIERYPDASRAFLKGLIRGYRVIRDQPTNLDYLNDLDTRMRSQAYEDPEERQQQIAHTASKWASAPYPIDGTFPVIGLQTVIEQEYAAERLPDMLDATTLVDLHLVHEANAELNARPELQEELIRCQTWVDHFGY